MITKVQQKSRREGRNGERGAIAVMMGILLTGIMGFAALGFDLAYVRLARLEMKNASDAAAHAGLVRLRNSSGDEGLSRTAAINIASQNKILGKSLTLQPNDVTFGTWDPTTKAFTAGASPANAVQIDGVRESSASNDGYINLTFGRVLGYTQSSITQDTVGAFVNRNFVIEMDITPTFICSMDQATQAVLALLDQLHTKNIGGDRIALEVFTGKAMPIPVGTNTGFLNIRDNYTAIWQAWAGGGTYTSILPGPKTAGITPCNKIGYPGQTWTCGTTTYAYPNNPNLQNCWDWGTPPVGYVTPLYAGTDIGAAIRSGTTKLGYPNTQNYEPRVLIIVTDGVPMTCTAPEGGPLCGTAPCCADGFCNVSNAIASGHQYRIDACNAAHANLDATVAAANAAETAKIDLFTIKVGGGEFDTGSNFAKSLHRRRGTGKWIADASQLGAAFTEILGHVPVSLVK